MPYDGKLAQRIRDILKGQAGLTEKKMFGGVGFMLNGNMACGIYKGEMIVRVDPSKHDALVAKSHARTMVQRDKPMKGWLLVGPQGFASDKDLKEWVQQDVAYAQSLPGKCGYETKKSCFGAVISIRHRWLPSQNSRADL